MPLTAHAANRKDRATPQTVELQHRHFAFIASALRNAKTAPHLSEQGWVEVATVFANMCENTNPRFDRSRFLVAAGFFGEPFPKKDWR